MPESKPAPQVAIYLKITYKLIPSTTAKSDSRSQAGIGAVFTIDASNRIIFCASASGLQPCKCISGRKLYIFGFPLPAYSFPYFLLCKHGFWLCRSRKSSFSISGFRLSQIQRDAHQRHNERAALLNRLSNACVSRSHFLSPSTPSLPPSPFSSLFLAPASCLPINCYNLVWCVWEVYVLSAGSSSASTLSLLQFKLIILFISMIITITMHHHDGQNKLTQ